MLSYIYEMVKKRIKDTPLNISISYTGFNSFNVTDINGSQLRVTVHDC